MSTQTQSQATETTPPTTGPGPRLPGRGPGGRGNAAMADLLRRRPRPGAQPPATTEPAPATTETTPATSTETTPATTETAPATGAQTAPAAGALIDEAALTAVNTAVVAVVPAEMATAAGTAIPAILRQAANRNIRNVNQVAYILATAQHESRFGHTLYSRSEPLVEDRNQFSSRTRGKTTTWSATVHTNDQRVTASSEEELETRYWDSAYGGRLGNERGTTDARDFRGRGFVQLTGRDNYRAMSERLSREGFSYTLDGVTWGGQGNAAIDLTAHPDHVNRSQELAARVLVGGMMDGQFTTRALGDYVNDQQTDYTNARAVVNGDTAENGATIAGIARTYEAALSGWSRVFLPAPAARGAERA